MQLVLSSSFAEDQNVINEHNGKFRQLVSRVDKSMSIEFRRVEQIVHDSLEGSRCIDKTKRQDPELVVTKRCPECSLRLVLIPKQDLVKTRGSIKTREVACTKQLVKENINAR